MEQRRYTQKELCCILKENENKIILIIQKLKEFGILKTVKNSVIQRDMSDLLDEDVEVVDVKVGEDEYLYVFTFVGIIVVAGRVLKCYPKYLMKTEQPKNELRKVLRVLEKYNTKQQLIRMFDASNESSTFNLLAVLLFLLHDYYENGVYSNTKDIIEINGPGEILWDKTINETFTLLSNNRTYYIELQTKKRVTDDLDYFKRLHECVLTNASRELKDAGLLDLFEIEGVNLTEEQLDDFGDKDQILYRIENELYTQFNTRKQLVLKTIYSYIEHCGSLSDVDGMSLYGTNKFELVWQDVCADIFNNQLDVRLGDLGLPIQHGSRNCKGKKLSEIIERPKWTITGKRADKTLTLDFVTIVKSDQGYQFIIFDAKYYTPKLVVGIPPKRQPGIESITKQYCYQLAFQKFIERYNFSAVKNCFIMPTENNKVELQGEVRLKMFADLGLQDIKVRFLPADMAYTYYLSGKKIDVGCLYL